MDRFTNEARKIGLTGKHSPHSLRYAYAQDAIGHHEKQGFSIEEAWALTSMDLGHGDGHGLP